MTLFTVTNTNDSGAGSLRQAIEDANALSGQDEIIFEDSLSGETITLASGQLEITDSITVRGLGADRLTLRGNTETRAFDNRIFNISDGFENQDTFFDVEIIGLTLTEGSSFGFRATGQGGAVDNEENLTITNSILSNNSAVDFGGAISNSGILKIQNSAIVDNTVTGGFVPLDGGGIYNSGTATIINSTIANNSANAAGGGILNSNNAVLEVINSTITGNTVNRSEGRYSGSGAGIYNLFDTRPQFAGQGTVTITSSIVARNLNAIDDSPADLGGGVFDDSEIPAPFNSGGNNLIGNGDTADGFTDGVNGDFVGTTDAPIDPRLSTLQNNGGSTPTIALLSDSPAVDAGSNPLNLEFDQRGAGFARVRGSQTDIGAFEADIDINPPEEGELILGTNRRDSLVGGAGDDTINGFEARDTIIGGEGDDDLFGGKGKDLIFGDAGNDEIAGNQGGDTLEGGSGSDTLFGDRGRDVLVGGMGLDILIGGGASDSFVIASGKDTDGIIDFEPRKDKLLLSEELSFSGLTLTQNNEDVDIILAETNELLAVLIDTDVNNVRESDFIAD